MEVIYTKQAITVDEQIEVLKRCGLLIEDEVQAKESLNAISYFRLADYWRHLEADRRTHQFRAGSSFN